MLFLISAGVSGLWTEAFERGKTTKSVFVSSKTVAFYCLTGLVFSTVCALVTINFARLLADGPIAVSCATFCSYLRSRFILIDVNSII